MRFGGAQGMHLEVHKERSFCSGVLIALFRSIVPAGGWRIGIAGFLFLE
jgi:hypothetical protein